NKRDLDEPSLNPPSKISALITQFNEALNKASNKEAIHSAYEELLAALGFDATMIYIDKLKAEIAQANNGVCIKNLAQLIKEKSITLNVMKTAEDTALIVAAKQGNMQAVIALCQEKTALNIQRTTKDSTGNTALHYLVKLPDSDEAIIALLTHSSWTTDPTRVQDNDGNNPLHLLASLGKEQTLKALDDHFTTKGKLWGQYSGLYNKFGYQPKSGQVVGMVSGNTQFQAAVFAQNKLGLTPIMVALLTHPENQALINYLCKAMNLDAQDQHLYVDLADAIVNKDSVKIESIVKGLNQNKTTGWNPQAPAIQVPQLKNLCEQAAVKPNVDIK
ncbi:MAG: ankyrin repeat domain-containing protein, partial [Candidatus Berkiella sp.]